jgi:phosphate transport system substrate-binding protein
MDTPAAQIAIVRAGFVDQGITRTDVKRQGDRLVNAIRQAADFGDVQSLQSLVGDIADRSRLSLSFRFMPGTQVLDPQSRSNIRLLANALESGTLGVSDVLFVGFASTHDGSDNSNAVEASAQSAADVQRRVMNAAATMDRRGLRIRSVGYGDIMPLACNTEVWGQHLNNRVEIWVR